jgi:hypothetical protein
VLAAFLRRAEAREALTPAPDPGVNVPGLRALALAGRTSVALWVHAPRARYGDAVRGASLTVHGLAPGRFRITWMDDTSGVELRAEEHDLAGEARVEVPAFTRHVAGLLERLPDREAGANDQVGSAVRSAAASRPR